MNPVPCDIFVSGGEGGGGGVCDKPPNDVSSPLVFWKVAGNRTKIK